MYGIESGFLGAGEEEFAFAGVGGERGGAGKFFLRFGEAAEFGEEIAADGGEQMIAFEGRLGGECVYDFEAGRRTGRHCDGYGAI